jgi:hypothetical protein
LFSVDCTRVVRNPEMLQIETEKLPVPFNRH